MDFPQYGEVFYFYGHAICIDIVTIIDLVLPNRPTKRGKENSPSDGYCQCQKEMDDHLQLLACQQFLT
jgi:hypothetical protein